MLSVVMLNAIMLNVVAPLLRGSTLVHSVLTHKH
jgi:hypothetical protein